MYSRNNRDGRGTGEYSVPPGYDGSRFRRRRRTEEGRVSDEVILIPDSDFAPVADTAEESGELSVGGIPTRHGAREQRRRSAIVEEEPAPPLGDAPPPEEPHKESEKLSGILDKLGFTGGLSSDELLLCAVIFLIASDRDNEGKNAGDILLILALLLGIR